MNGDPLVSIRCLVYNHEPYLRQCLDGFVMQKTTFPFEAIVHDDASTDGSATIIREYAEKFPDIIKPIYETENQYRKHNGSLTRIMDAAMHPNSKYIALCEGDDYWTDPNKLQVQVDFLESHPDYSMCFHRANTINFETGEENNSFPGKVFRNIQCREYDSTELFEVWTVPTASMVYKRECQFFPLNRRYIILYGDILRVLSCAEMGKIRGCSRMMSVYRVHNSGMTFSSDSNMRFVMHSPEHYLFIKDNFPKVDLKLLCENISYRFWVRASHQIKKKPKMMDYMMSFKYDFWGSSKRTFVSLFPKVYSKYSNFVKRDCDSEKPNK